MERHGHDQRTLDHGAPGAPHGAGHRQRDTGATAIFQLERKRASDRPKSDRGARSIEGWRIREAGAASRRLIEG